MKKKKNHLQHHSSETSNKGRLVRQQSAALHHGERWQQVIRGCEVKPGHRSTAAAVYDERDGSSEADRSSHLVN